jgi:hypothetical protein
MTMTDQDRQATEGIGSVLGLVMGEILRAATLYLDQGVSDEPVGPEAERAILDELLLVATVLRVADHHRELLARLTGVLDPGPTLAVLRAVQDSLILALSDEPRVRTCRIGERELRDRLRAEPVRRFLEGAAS